MNSLFVCIIAALVAPGLLQIADQWTPAPNELVLVVTGAKGNKNLRCLASEEKVLGGEVEDIFWKKNGEPQREDGDGKNRFRVFLGESYGGGNYTCHGRDGRLLNYTVLMIQKEENKPKKIMQEDDKGDYLKCSTKNYSGPFSCSWKTSPTRTSTVVAATAECLGIPSGRCNISCSWDDSGNQVACKWCSLPSEMHIRLDVTVRSEHYLAENYSTVFWLAKIVRPDPPEITWWNSTTLELLYPESWSRSSSFYPLRFDVWQMPGQCRGGCSSCTDAKSVEGGRRSRKRSSQLECLHNCYFPVKPRTRTVCVRVEDLFTASQWSKWATYSVEE